MTCKYRECQREAVKGHTTCAAHFSAGCSVKQETRKTRRSSRKAM